MQQWFRIRIRRHRTIHQSHWPREIKKQPCSGGIKLQCCTQGRLSVRPNGSGSALAWILPASLCRHQSSTPLQPSGNRWLRPPSRCNRWISSSCSVVQTRYPPRLARRPPTCANALPSLVQSPRCYKHFRICYATRVLLTPIFRGTKRCTGDMMACCSRSMSIESLELLRLICIRSITMHIHTRPQLTLRLRSVLLIRLPSDLPSPAESYVREAVKREPRPFTACSPALAMERTVAYVRWLDSIARYSRRSTGHRTPIISNGNDG
jgi:hypothetical protein